MRKLAVSVLGLLLAASAVSACGGSKKTPAPQAGNDQAADRTDCAAMIGGSGFRSDSERDWFNANCASPDSNPAPADPDATPAPADAPVTLVSDDGQVSRARRDDRVHEAGLTLSERLGRRLRAGFTAGYTSRRSSFADLGLAGLLLGGTLTFVP